jgi:hypothetical protein
LVAGGRVARHRVQHDVLEALRHAGAHLTGPQWLGVEAGERGARVGLGAERRPAAQRLVQHDAERVHVGRRPHRPALHLLGRQVLRGAEHRPLSGVVLARLGDAEVGDHHAAVAAQQDVRRLDVAVDDARMVGRGQRVCGLSDDRHGLRRFERALLVEPLTQRRPAHELHHDGLDAVVAARVVDRHDRRVRQPGGRDCFGAEAGEERLVRREVRMEDLDRHLAGEDLVRRLPHLRHPTGRDQVIEPVPPRHEPALVADRLGTGRQRRLRHGSRGQRGDWNVTPITRGPPCVPIVGPISPTVIVSRG